MFYTKIKPDDEIWVNQTLVIEWSSENSNFYGASRDLGLIGVAEQKKPKLCNIWFMKKIICFLIILPLLAACSGSNSAEIKSSSYYEAVEQVWDGLDASAKASVCSFVDGENDEGAFSLFKIGLKFDLDINIDENAEKYDEAINLFVNEKC